jgi:hypothetical protein
MIIVCELIDLNAWFANAVVRDRLAHAESGNREQRGVPTSNEMA